MLPKLTSSLPACIRWDTWVKSGISWTRSCFWRAPPSSPERTFTSTAVKAPVTDQKERQPGRRSFCNSNSTTGRAGSLRRARDLVSTRKFFCDCLGWRIVGERADYPAVFVSDGHDVVTLWQVESSSKAIPFDRRANVGLHHLALAVVDQIGLDTLYKRVSGWPNVLVEFGPELSGAGPKIHFMVREPGGARIEVVFDPRLEEARKA